MVYALHFATNIVREIYPALSLGEQLSFDVSEYTGLHPDIFEIPGRGTFINNNPGASILGAIPYAIARPIIDIVVKRVQHARTMRAEWRPREYDTIHKNSREFYRKATERGLDVKFGLAAGVMQIFCMAPLSALSVLVMFYVLATFTPSERMALVLALLYAFATPVFYRTAQLNHNLLVGHFAFFAFVLLWRPWDDPASPQRPRYLIAGLLCGWTVVLDYSGTVALIVLGIYAFARRHSLPRRAKARSDLLQFFLGVGLSIAVLAGYQWLCFGSPFFPAQNYMPPTDLTTRGYLGFDWPKMGLLWKTAFDIRYGLFTSAPFLLLALFFPGWCRGDLRIVKGLELRFVLGLVIAFFLFCAANQYGYVQFNTGVRHIVPVTPFLFLLAAAVFLRMPTSLAILLGITTTYWSWCLAMYRDVEYGLGIFEAIINITFEGFQFPWLKTLESMGYFDSKTSTVPLLMLLAAILWVIWTSEKPIESPEHRKTTGLWQTPEDTLTDPYPQHKAKRKSAASGGQSS
jgi:hypothetical protein